MRILITGSSGQLGTEIVRQLCARHETLGLDLLPGPGTELVADLADRATLAEALRGTDAIIHTAALVAVWRREPSEFDAVNVGGLQSVLAAARAQRVPRVFYTSSFLALPPAGSPQLGEPGSVCVRRRKPELHGLSAEAGLERGGQRRRGVDDEEVARRQKPR